MIEFIVAVVAAAAITLAALALGVPQLGTNPPGKPEIQATEYTGNAVGAFSIAPGYPNGLPAPKRGYGLSKGSTI